ncbi:MAG TPA: cytidylate kinase family protein [Candidatus Binatia bacterium]|nr:cytidylate kinase family protein [Candidatus Binatia bacterium]
MPIITIFGGTFGDDEELARNVATKLDCQFVSREIFVAASQRCDVPEAKLNDIVEKQPHWWERWHENLGRYRIALEAAMSEAALAENLVYVGHVGHGLLPGIRHVVRVLLTAPMEYRIEQVRQRQELDSKAARRYIDHVEKAHTRRLMALFGSDWRDPAQYALILNMAQMSSAAAENIIAHTAKLTDYQVTAESRQALGDLALTAKIQARLLTHPTLRGLNVSVQAKQGEVTLAGLLPQSVSEYEVRHVVEGMPGVKNVMSDFVSLRSRALR